MDLLARIEVDGVCLGGIRLSGVLRPKQVASVGAQTKTRAWAFRLGSSWSSGVSHARCKWLPATCSPYHTSIRARLATPDRSLLPVTSNILPTKADDAPYRLATIFGTSAALWLEASPRQPRHSCRTLRASSHRRTRIRPSPDTNIHESFQRLSEGIRNKPLSCFFVSGEAPLSCPEASATSRRLKRRGEARRRSFDLIVRLKG